MTIVQADLRSRRASRIRAVFVAAIVVAAVLNGASATAQTASDEEAVIYHPTPTPGVSPQLIDRLPAVPGELPEEALGQLDALVAAGGRLINDREVEFNGGNVIVSVYGNSTDCRYGYLCAFQDPAYNTYARNAVCQYLSVSSYYETMASDGQICVDTMSSFWNRRADMSLFQDSPKFYICARAGSYDDSLEPVVDNRMDRWKNRLDQSCTV